MNTKIEIPENTALFSGVETGEIMEMLGCLQPQRREYVRGEVILRSGSRTDTFGLILSGSALITQEDFWGNRNILSDVTPGELFGESYAARPAEEMTVSVVAAEDCAVLFLNLRRVLTTCSSACSHHRKLIENLLAVVSEKNQRLNEKLTHISQRSTRQKLLSYLSAQACRAHSSVFEIPFNRQELADYLSVDRSALSAELSRLKSEGMLDYYRNSFKMLDNKGD